MRIWQVTRIISATIVLFAPSEQLAGPLDAESVDQIRAPFAERRKAQNPVWIKYHLKYTETSAWRNATSTTKSTNDVIWECDAEYAVKGSKFRSWVIFQNRPELPEGHER